MQEVFSKVQVHIPYHLLPQYQEMLVGKRLNPEIYFSQYALKNMDMEKCRETAKIFADHGLKVTFHAPFMDLRPGALDDKIRKVSVHRMKQAIELARYFQPLRIVCHPMFDDRYYVDCDDLWLEASLKSWRELIDAAKAHDTILSLENVYDKGPHLLRRLFDALDSDRVCFCFDTGHYNAYAQTPLNVWFEELGKYLGQLHLHDNFGERDEHLPVGEGNFPFGKFFEELKKNGSRPVVTLEAHAQEELFKSLDNIIKMDFIDCI
ncbi:MAG TPA: sugar phosphate isomerase/epimerase [Deltaproteobacteria bacterium]|mgnify:CR=1 FL=1|nr:sugar phosphate isomerase/epimerase [Deltaproteobacteria bacterium]